MSELVTLRISPTIDCMEESERIGRQLYKQNKNYQVIANCMENPEFRKMFDEHFSDLDSLKTILIFLKLYQKIEKSSHVELSGYQKITIMDSIVKDRRLRHEICKEVSNNNQELLN